MRVDNQSTRNARAQRNGEINREQVLKLLEAAQDYFRKKPSPDENARMPFEQRLSGWKHYEICPAYLQTNYDTGELFTKGECDCDKGKLITSIEAITGQWK
jgi:hypothetical protein